MARFTLHVPMRWGDLDAYGHMNNARMLSLLEEARIMAFWSGGEEGGVPEEGRFSGGVGSTTNTFIVRQEIEYLRSLAYGREPVRIDVWVCKLGGASLDVAYVVYDPEGEVVAQAITVMVLVDAQTHRPRRLGDRERAFWESRLEAAPKMRRG